MMRIFEVTLTVAIDDYTDEGDSSISALDPILMELADIPELQVIGYNETEKVLVDKYQTPNRNTSIVKFPAEPSEISDAFLDWSDSQADAIKDAIVEQEITEQINKNI